MNRREFSSLAVASIVFPGNLFAKKSEVFARFGYVRWDILGRSLNEMINNISKKISNERHRISSVKELFCVFGDYSWFIRSSCEMNAPELSWYGWMEVGISPAETKSVVFPGGELMQYEDDSKMLAANISVDIERTFPEHYKEMLSKNTLREQYDVFEDINSAFVYAAEKRFNDEVLPELGLNIK